MLCFPHEQCGSCLQSGNTKLLCVRKLHRCFTLREVGRHGVQLSASESDFPGTSSSRVYRVFTFEFLIVHSFQLSTSPSLFVSMWLVPGHKQRAQQVAWLHSGHQDTQPAVWQWSWHVPHHWDSGGYQQRSMYFSSSSRCHYLLVYSPAGSHIFGSFVRPTSVGRSFPHACIQFRAHIYAKLLGSWSGHGQFV